MEGAAALFSSARPDWRTPPQLFAALDREFHFTLDVCATRDNKLCDRYIGPDHHEECLRDALNCVWGRGETCFMNPPYSRGMGIDIAAFVQKALLESECNTVVALLPARTDTLWWHEYVMQAAEIRLLPGRVRFHTPEGMPANTATFPSAVVVWSAEYRRPHIAPWTY
jgi:phage N-6-adenine-methyltransferase